MFEVTMKQVEEKAHVSRSNRMRVGELSSYIRTTIHELIGEHEPTGPPFTVFHGQVNETDDGPVEVGVPTRAGDKCLPGGELEYTVASGPACTFPEIIGAYDVVAGWARRTAATLSVHRARSTSRWSVGRSPGWSTDRARLFGWEPRAGPAVTSLLESGTLFGTHQCRPCLSD